MARSGTSKLLLTQITFTFEKGNKDRNKDQRSRTMGSVTDFNSLTHITSVYHQTLRNSDHPSLTKLLTRGQGTGLPQGTRDKSANEQKERERKENTRSKLLF